MAFVVTKIVAFVGSMSVMFAVELENAVVPMWGPSVDCFVGGERVVVERFLTLSVVSV